MICIYIYMICIYIYIVSIDSQMSETEVPIDPRYQNIRYYGSMLDWGLKPQNKQNFPGAPLEGTSHWRAQTGGSAWSLGQSANG